MYTAETESGTAPSDAATDVAVVLHGVSKVIDNRTLLADVSLTVERRRIHGVIGPNGSGKTTLLRVLAGIWLPDAGRIERTDVTPHSTGYVPQRFYLYDELTVRENLRFQGRMRGCGREAVVQTEQAFNLGAFEKRRAGSLSGGQRQRLLIAAALMSRPTLLLLDEPTTALDAPSRQSLWELLQREARRGTAIVLTTHEEADVAQCDIVTRLHDGRVVNRHESSMAIGS